MKPITPQEVIDKKIESLPDGVIDEWNRAIAANWNNGQSVVVQKDVIGAIAGRMGVSRDEVFDNGWADIESLYRAVGWNVFYDKPGYNENYEASFTFTKPKKKKLR